MTSIYAALNSIPNNKEKYLLYAPLSKVVLVGPPHCSLRNVEKVTHFRTMKPGGPILQYSLGWNGSYEVLWKDGSTL